METNFKASESLEMLVEEQTIPIHHYLRQPQRLVEAIADPKLMEQLSESNFRLKMRPINFMEIYHFQPMVVLKVWADARGTVYLLSESCEIRGIEYINKRFSLKVKGILSPEQKDGKTYLKGQADLEVEVDVPPPLNVMPKHLLEVTGNGLLKSVLLRIKQRLLSHLLHDYYQWMRNEPALKELHAPRYC